MAEQLPPELFVSILNFFQPGHGVLSLRCVCKAWKDVIDSEYYWREAFQKWYCGQGDWCRLQSGGTWKEACATAITQINYLSSDSERFAWAVGAAPRYWAVAARTVASAVAFSSRSAPTASSVIKSAFLAACADNHVPMMHQLLAAPHMSVNVRDDKHTPLYVASRAGALEVVSELLALGAHANAREGDASSPLAVAARGGHTAVVRLLLGAGAAVDWHTQRHGTALHVAAQYGRADVMRVLLEKGADVHVMQKHAETPLLLATRTGNVQLVRMLLEAGASVNAASVEGESPLMSACQALPADAEPTLVETLLCAGADVNARKSSSGKTALVVATQSGRLDVMQLLVKHRADVHLARNGFTPLHVAASGGHAPAAKFLLARGSAVDASTDDGKTPLYLASSLGHVEVVRTLIGSGAAVTPPSFRRASPLNVAARAGHEEVVRALLDVGADPNEMDPRRPSPLTGALSGMHWGVASLLLNAGADVTKCCPKSGMSPILLAAGAAGADAIVQQLLAAGGGARLNTAEPCEGITPLIAAVRAKSLAVAAALIEHGADANRESGDGRTPLHYAVEMDEPELLPLLLRAKANPLAKDVHGKTPLEYACRSGNAAAVATLLKHRSVTQYDSSAVLEAAQVGSLRILQMLLSDIRYLSAHGLSRNNILSLALWVAARNGHAPLVQHLISLRANVNVPHREMTPIFVACRFGHAEVASLLLSNGADPNVPRGNGDTPLFIAAREGHDAIVQLLLGVGAEA
eukprot:TRINITY_DN5737_c1_g1_i1.p1 TRINITY_DN5737_c1_g1~~TRINITY_DN5737_c1_g1_i1.p1  ORF type:complete len:840 (+),score=264.02 TRINITY_DN5737_c1_g1_i1:267-2522(+)